MPITKRAIARSARRSFLMAPGDNSVLLRKQAASDADVAVICVEDAVLPQHKVRARNIASHALLTHDYGRKERFVRINSLETEYWLEDIEHFCATAPPTGFTLTKIKTPNDIGLVARVLDNLERRNGIDVGSILISCYIETAEAMRYVYDIAGAHPRMANLHFGAEDYTHSIDAIRTPEQFETLYAMSRIVSAARAAGVEPINVMHTKVHDEAGLRKTSVLSRELGFTGRSCPSPRHISILNEIFSPSESQINYAIKVAEGFRVAKIAGSGVYMVEGGMVDGPMIWKAMRVLQRAGLSEKYRFENDGSPEEAAP
jgi:citrate lyase subunit beta / citryl-CoA lyase